MIIESIDIKELNAAEYNPRIDLQEDDEEYKKLVKSINEYGYVDPIIWNRKTGNVVGGHQRLKVLKKLGNKKIDVSVVELDIIKEKELNIALNKINGDWDEEKLSVLLEELSQEGDVTMTGFDMDEVNSFIDQYNKNDVIDDDFDLETDLENQRDIFTQKGDLWLLGCHKLLCGDATNIDDVNKIMGDEQADMIFTDPPYNVNYEGKTGEKLTIQNDKMSDGDFLKFLLAVFNNYYEISKKGCSIYVCHADSEGKNFREAFVESGFKLAQCLIWVKNVFVMGRQDYHWKHEPILYGWKEGASHYFIDDRTQSTVWEVDKPLKNAEHPTMKPLELCSRAIVNSSKVNELVVDFFGGSGSTLISSDINNRRCNTIELDERYCDVIVRRYINHVGNSENVKLIRNGLKTEYTNKDIGIDE